MVPHEKSDDSNFQKRSVRGETACNWGCIHIVRNEVAFCHLVPFHINKTSIKDFLAYQKSF